MNNELKAIILARDDAVRKAWASLAGYKFLMFGYHAARFVNYNKLLDREHRVGSPFTPLVTLARKYRVIYDK